MIETFTEFLKFVSDYLIKGMSVSILLMIIVKLVFKNKLDLSTKIVKWIILVYSFGVLLNTVLLYAFPIEKYAFLERATGPYAWAYWLMFSLNAMLPFVLLYHKPGRNLYLLFTISLLMNIGWLFESFVVHASGLHRNFITADYNPYLPNEFELRVILSGFLLGIMLLVLETIAGNINPEMRKTNQMQ
ncbi:MAG: hypothetical protein CFE23_02225 [Flavobacterium sp. BFFFF1]|uniref:hypothetical protein n=1 Tax=Flavobacterium sp. BFFFF1 TaxID=2015557 RepID=UPI000BC42C50|nr:hypothetical protein [Flavobacterium sp. BFFFF1]OYU81723.1 MAG: hypothetical protein CFE23_02225 [Flavobacterium sp. BFFFF1]